MGDNYNYSLDTYWPECNLTEKEMDIIDKLGKTGKVLYYIMMEDVYDRLEERIE